jgi:hypothetical protein
MYAEFLDLRKTAFVASALKEEFGIRENPDWFWMAVKTLRED